jgi:hypothetical protein
MFRFTSQYNPRDKGGNDLTAYMALREAKRVISKCRSHVMVTPRVAEYSAAALRTLLRSMVPELFWPED